MPVSPRTPYHTSSSLAVSSLRPSCHGSQLKRDAWIPPAGPASYSSMSNGSASAAGSTRPPPSPLKNQPRQTQRYAAERLLDTLRKHTALVPPRDQHVHSVDEVLTLGASAVFGLTEEVQAQQREVERLQGELAAAYRASAIAAADDIGAARRQAEDTEQRAAHAAQQAVAREAELEAVVLSTHGQLAEEQRARAACSASWSRRRRAPR